MQHLTLQKNWQHGCIARYAGPLLLLLHVLRSSAGREVLLRHAYHKVQHAVTYSLLRTKALVDLVIPCFPHCNDAAASRAAFDKPGFSQLQHFLRHAALLSEKILCRLLHAAHGNVQSCRCMADASISGHVHTNAAISRIQSTYTWQKGIIWSMQQE